VWYRVDDSDDSHQATVDWSWGTVRYRLGSVEDDNDDDNEDDDIGDESDEPVLSPQSTDVGMPSHVTDLQVPVSVLLHVAGVAA